MEKGLDGGSNGLLRGEKGSTWEGGLRYLHSQTTLRLMLQVLYIVCVCVCVCVSFLPASFLSGVGCLSHRVPGIFYWPGTISPGEVGGYVCALLC